MDWVLRHGMDKRMENLFPKIETGSRVGIIGGGPAGSLFALYLLHYADEAGIQPEVLIFNQRDFSALGPKGCKGCAGILSVSLLKNLSQMGLRIPGEVFQSQIAQYIVHSPYTSIAISNPEKEIQIASIYRGGGPRLSNYEKPISFDGWLLQEAQKRGARVKNLRPSRAILGKKPLIEVEGEKEEYDLLVLAAGVNAKGFRILGSEYIPPTVRVMSQDELYAGADQVEAWLGNKAHVFLLPHSGLIFGSLVPKGPFINVSVLGSGKYPVSVSDFLSHDLTRKILLGPTRRSCGCRPKAVVGSAQHYYADGFVAIGDAAVSRLYKDGIGSAQLTAREAAHTAVFHGISRHAFERYYHPFCNRINWDNRWGRFLFALNDKTKDSRTFHLTQQRLIGNEQKNTRSPQPFTKAAWGMFTGGYPYRRIAWMGLKPISMIRFSSALIWESLVGLFQKEASDRRKLDVSGKRVLILGNGFGGTYALRHLVPSLNRNENVDITMVSDENFFLFTPLLHEVAMGRIEPRHIAYPIRRLHWRDRFAFLLATVEKIDLRSRKVATSKGVLDFDYLILALGSVSNIPDAAVAGKNIFTLKTLYDSMLLRNKIIDLFEAVSSEKDLMQRRQFLTFIVAGASYTGIQLVTELRDFIHRSLIKFYRITDPKQVRIILIEPEAKIIPELPTKLALYVMKHLQEMGIEIRLRSRITRLSEDRIEINGMEEVPTNTVVWAAGVLANPLISELEVEKDELGRVFVNEYLEVPGHAGVYAVGDCAHFEDPQSGKPIPPRAHLAVRQAKVAALNILAEIRGRHKKPYRYSNPPEMISLGASRAVLRFYGFQLYGFSARFIWLSAYSLLITGMGNRSRIVLDWLLSFVLGRDTALLKFKKIDPIHSELFSPLAREPGRDKEGSWQQK